MHLFAVGRVFEQPDVQWVEQIVRDGHPVGNHTYDHVYVLARKPEEIQFRFKRAPWLIAGRSIAQVIEDNIQMTTAAMAPLENRGITLFRSLAILMALNSIRFMLNELGAG